MTPELVKQVSKAWSEYLVLSEAERPAFLKQLRSDNADIATELELRLMRQQAATQSHAPTPAQEKQDTGDYIKESLKLDTVDYVKGDVSSPSFHRADSNTQMGLPTVAGYELLDILGCGGMGVVYKARDLKLNRLVALKMIRAGDHASVDDLERFRTEAEAVARLQHPHIVQIHEIGEHDGLPYFSLEFCAGGSLNSKLDGTPWQPKETAALVETLAYAMQAAHEAQVIHRDLKPHNVLLSGKTDDDLFPKITDFGLAKKLDVDEGRTHSGVVMGTPSYMAPEQATGTNKEIGPAADTYALGAILYQLQTGRPPFKAATMWDTIGQVLNEEPVPPRQLNTKMPKDLETICLKCLHKDPNRRYGSTQLLAEDLHRFGQGEPILARPIRSWERAWRWCVRRPAVAALLALVVLVTAVGFGLVVWQWRRAEANFLQADNNYKESEQQRKHRDINFRKAMEAVKKMLTRAGHKSLENVPGMTKVRRGLLQDALAFYEGFLEEKSDDPELIAETGRAYRIIGLIHELLQQHDQAEKAYQQAITLFEKLRARFPNRRQVRQGLAHARIALGNHFYNLERYKKAEPLLRDSVSLNKELVRDFPDHAEHKLDLAEAQQTLGGVFQYTGRVKESAKAYQTALDLYASLDKTTANSARCREERSQCLFSFGSLLFQLGKPGEAEHRNAEALTLQKSLVKDFPEQVHYRQFLATQYQHVGVSLMRGGQLPEARRSLAESIATLEKLKTDFPNVPDHRFNLAGCFNVMAVVASRQGDTKQVEHFFRRRMEILKKLADDFPKRVEFRKHLSLSYSNLGVFMHRSGRTKEAVRFYTEALNLRRQMAKDYPDSPGYRSDVAISCGLLGQMLPEARHKEAVQLLQESIRLGEALVSEFPKNPRYQHKLAQSYRTLGDRLMDRDPPQAEKQLRKAAATFRMLSSNNPDYPNYRRFLGSTLNVLGQLQYKRGRRKDAETSYRESAEVFKKLATDFAKVTEFRREYAVGLISLGRFLAIIGTYKEVDPLVQTAVARLTMLNADHPENPLIQKNLSRAHHVMARYLSTWAPVTVRDPKTALTHARKALKGNPKHSEYHTTLGIVHYRLGDWKRARAALTQAGQLESEHKDPGRLFFLAMVHWRQKAKKEARRVFDQAIALVEKDHPHDEELRHVRQEAATLLDVR